MSIEKNRFKQKNDSQLQYNYGRPAQLTPRNIPIQHDDTQSSTAEPSPTKTDDDYADWREVAAIQMSPAPVQPVSPTPKQEELEVKAVPKVSPDAPKPVYEQVKATFVPADPPTISRDEQAPLSALDRPNTTPNRSRRQALGRLVKAIQEQISDKAKVFYDRIRQIDTRYKVGVASLFLILIVGFFGHNLLRGSSPIKGSQAAIGNIAVKRNPASANKLSDTSVAGADAQPRPSFSLLAPADKPQLADPTKAGHTYDQAKNVYSYTDLVVGVPITVSQQPIPSGEGSAQSKIDDIATKMSATQQIPTNSGIAYLQIDTKNNVHVVVFTKKDILVLIRGTYPLPANVWTEYINSLQ